MRFFIYLQTIGNKVTIYPNYDISYSDYTDAFILDSIISQMKELIATYNIVDENIIFLLDLTRIRPENMRLILLNKIIGRIRERFPQDYLYKLIIYDYAPSVSFLLPILKTIMINLLSKLIIDKNYKKVIAPLLLKHTTQESVEATVSNNL
tara:strand:- start:6353 stop:6805 length:453 start_codon:yes stop_codon:yes gene_type:complete